MFTELSKEVKFAIPLANSTFCECLRALVKTIYYTSHKNNVKNAKNFVQAFNCFLDFLVPSMTQHKILYSHIL